MNFCRKNKNGFTLVELLVVISVIALLLAVLMPALNKAREQGRKVQCAAHIGEAYYLLHTSLQADAKDSFVYY